MEGAVSEKKIPEINICGLTRIPEAGFLTIAGAENAGFVFFEKSKRNVTVPQAQKIMKGLNPEIKKVAVMVSPDTKLIQMLQEAGFDILQIHGTLSEEVLKEAQLPVWYAVNIARPEELKEKTAFFERLPQRLQDKVQAIVVDGAVYGSGKTFDWKQTEDVRKQSTLFSGRKFILAGGLNASNVREGIEIFSPDVVDVSSGVEKTEGKDERLIQEFVSAVRQG